MAAKSRYATTDLQSIEYPVTIPATTPTITSATTSTTTSATKKRSSPISTTQEGPLSQRRRSMSISPSSQIRPRRSQSSELPPEVFSSDNEYFSEQEPSTNFSPMNIDTSASQSRRSSQDVDINVQQSKLQDDEEKKVARVVRHFINVFVQNPNLWNEFKEVVESTLHPVAIPSIKGKEVQHHTPVSQQSSQVIYY